MIHFIVNATSGSSAGTKALRVCSDICMSKGLSYSVNLTERKAHAEEHAKNLSAAGEGLIVAIGGDGTFHEVLNGIDPAVTAVGFVPAGSGNDFARAAKLQREPAKAFNDILRGDKKQIDYIQVSNRRCLNVAGTGMDVDVLTAVYGKTNALTYYTSLLACLAKFKPYDVRIKTGGETIEKSCIMVGVCNGVAIGGGITLSPQSEIDDGKLNLIIMEKKDRGLLKILPKFMKGKHMDFPETTHMLIEDAEIVSYGLRGDIPFDESAKKPPIQLDGEIYEDLPFVCNVVKNGLTTFKTSLK